MQQQICTYRGAHNLQKHYIADLQVLYICQPVKSLRQESHKCGQKLPVDVL